MKLTLKIITPILIVIVAFIGFKSLKASAPEPKSKQPAPAIPEVTFISVSPTDHSPPVRTFGSVSPYFETTLTPQISARITEVSPSFRVGRIVKEGYILVRLDSTDFRSALATQMSNLTIAQRTLAEEKIRAEQAAADWKASGRDLKKASSFVLREPQLDAARANIESAQAAIEKAQADLERTNLSAPFDAIVTARSASLGNFANPQSQLGTLIATERVEVLLPLTAEQVTRITLPSENSPGPELILTSPLLPEAKWPARLVRRAPTISRDQVLTVIAEIAHPFSASPPLSIGTFVKAEINALPIKNSYKIPEAALVNDTFLWALDPENKLVNLKATRLHSDQGTVYVRLAPHDLTPPLKIIFRPLTNFKNGMNVEPSEVQP